MTDIEWGGQHWQLRADRSMYWPSRSTLIVADSHFGKAAHFRAAGVPVPGGTTRHTLDRLDVALRATGAERLVVLGDFFHSRGGVCDGLLAQLLAWRERWWGLAVVNVRGNHDRQAGDPPRALGVECCSDPCVEPCQSDEPAVAFAHEPRAVSNASVLAGHVHPGVMLEGRGNDRMRLACFWLGSRVAVLPAFGAFTGMKVVRPVRGDRVFVVGPAAVREVTPPGSSGVGVAADLGDGRERLRRVR